LSSLKYLSSSILKFFKKRRDKKLRKIKDALIKEASMSANKLYFELAVVAYILSKITSKPRLTAPEYQDYLKDIEVGVRELTNAVRQGKKDTELFAYIKKIESSVKKMEKVDQRFLRDIVSKGRLKLAATMYAQGLSLGIASEMSGIEKQDIQDYSGNTMMFDRVKEEVKLKERLKKLKRYIGK
jgi:hypothetical protein